MMPDLPGGPGGQQPPVPAGRFCSRRYRFRRCRRLLVLAAVGLAAAGCGYTLVGSQTSPSHDGTATVAVVPFTNTTHEPVVEHFMTAALRQALLQQRGFTLKSAGGAELLVRGSVRDFRSTALSYDRDDNALVYRLQAEVRVVVLDGQESEPLLLQDVAAEAEYLVSRSGDVRETAVARDAALNLLARRFAERCSAWLTIALLEARRHAAN